MFLDNIKIYCFNASVDSVDEIINFVNSIKKNGETIQLLNAEFIVSKNHIFHGVNQAILAFKRNENFANDLGVEILLRCSAQRQISKAFNILGLKRGNVNLYAVFINCDYVDEFSSLFSLNDDFDCNFENVADVYNISDCEISNMSIEDVIIDRITKLTVDY